MKIKTIFHFKLFLTIFLAFAGILIFRGETSALTFNMSDYPGWCFKNMNDSAGILTVNLICCGDGGVSIFSRDYTQLNVNKETPCNNCIYTCRTWGSCNNGNKACLTFDHSPADATCSNAVQSPMYEPCYDTPSTCTDECTANGEKQCLGTTGYQTCGNYDDDSYLEWSSVINCPTGQTCASGVCSSSTVNTPSTTGKLTVKKVVDNAGGGTRQPHEFSFSVNGGSVTAFDTSGQSELSLAPGTYTVTEPTVPVNYTVSYNNCFNINLVASQTVTCTITNTYFADTDSSNIPCTSYTYSDWSACSSTGKQTRTISSSTPAGCVTTATGSATPVLEQTCTTATNSIFCTSYTYGAWSVCSSTGAQTKTIANKYPTGCVLPSSVAQTISQPCTVTNTTTTTNTATDSNNTTTNTTGTATNTTAATTADTTTGNTDDNTTKTTAKNIPCTSYTYDAWSACSSEGVQTRNIIGKYPAGCDDTSSAAYAPMVRQACALIKKCDSYDYSDWTVCSTAGTQTRKIIKQFLSGCNDTSSAVLEQNCDNLPPCQDYAYTSWSECDAAGKQKREIIKSSPDKCRGGNPPVLEQTCVPCEYAYSEWGDCQISGMRNRKLISQSPQNCFQKEPPPLEQKCEYVAPSANIEQTQTITSESSENKIALVEQKEPCVYSYTAWGACLNKHQTRMLLSATPENCGQTIKPQLEQNCQELPEILPPLTAAAPAPAPMSAIQITPSAPEPTSTANFNSRTGSEWQKYYFGSADCQDAAVCGGEVDPDNDGLSNNDEYRFGTNPKSPDTDRDGRVDADEIKNGRNPLVADSQKASDAVVYETPKEKGREVKEIYQVNDVSYDKNKEKLTLSGKALPNSYVTIYLYSDPMILTVKTDDNGNWLYVVDKPKDGAHEVYVVVNDNEGKIIAKSAPLPFVQTAEAATANYPARINNEEKASSPVKARLWEGYAIFLFASFGGLILTLVAVHLIRKINKSQ